MEPIVSSQNQQIKLIRALTRRKGRKETGLMILEGSRLIEDALEAGATLESLFHANTGDERIANIVSQAKSLDVPVFEVESELLASVSDTVTPQGVLALARHPAASLEQIMADDRGLVVAVDQVRDPGNVGTIIRTCAAAGVSGVVLTKGTADPFSPKVLRATMGTVFRTPIVVDAKSEELISQCQSRGHSLVVADASGQMPYYDVDMTEKTCLVIGNEAQGPEPFFVQSCDRIVRIPMSGGTESLNAAIAGGIILFEAVRQRNRSSEG